LPHQSCRLTSEEFKGLNDKEEEAKASISGAAHSNLSEENLFSTSTNDEPSLNS